MEHPTWRLSAAAAELHSAAHLQSAALCGEVDLKRPERGLFQLRWRNQTLANHEILGVELAANEAAGESLIDGYQRGGDLIAVYAETPQRPLRVQVYWRAANDADLETVVELQLSVQTSLLDSRPVLGAATRLPRGEVLRLVDVASGKFEPLNPAVAESLPLESEGRPLCWLVRWPDAGLSYVEMAQSGETHRSELSLSAAGRLELKHQLFVEPLEKGVILRTRIRGAYLPTAGDEPRAAQAYREFLQSPPPLTA